MKKLTPECDKTDYILAACSGAICGILDIFLVEGYEATAGELCGCAGESDRGHCGEQPDRKGFYCGQGAVNGGILRL